jgi:uncharacterized repeat protein (TIGR03803 family)
MEWTPMAAHLRRTGFLITLLALMGLPRQLRGDLTTLASFSGANGANPYGGVTFDAQGNMYGTTLNGGAYGDGAAWMIAAGSNTVTTLASFRSPVTNIGTGPYGGIVLDARGNLFGTTAFGGAYDYGNVWEIVKGSHTATTVTTFNDTNGAHPYAGLTIDAQGNLYGTTADGGPDGAHNQGTVFEVVKGSNTITTLAAFQAIPGGANPRGPMTIDARGNLYGTTISEAVNVPPTAFEIVKGSHTITNLATFQGTPGQGSLGAVSLDSHGNLFGTTVGDASSSRGTVWEIAKGSGTATTLASFAGTNGGGPYGGVTMDTSGNLFGTTLGGGPTGGVGTVWELASGSSVITDLGIFTGPNGANPYAGLTIGANGDLYGTTGYGGDFGDGTVFELSHVSISAVPEPSSALTVIAVSALVGFRFMLKRRRQLVVGVRAFAGPRSARGR